MALEVIKGLNAKVMNRAFRTPLVLHPVESRPPPRVSRFSHMVDVHTPGSFALDLA